ncbi:putative arylsulfatase regulatory protein [Vibrio maritimus]|uniref:Putative arylsulfatase regulatory protein n=1 Tax=Vibrio maritimus TaxID=990268 RepID=A0A090SGT4_9VIBR|nr:putative arylsulfatase regulatory protein [Vibrio maritimus]
MGEFLCAVFDEWLKADVGRVFVQYFEAAAQAWMGKGNPLCQLNQLCGKGLAMEPMAMYIVATTMSTQNTA